MRETSGTNGAVSAVVDYISAKVAVKNASMNRVGDTYSLSVLLPDFYFLQIMLANGFLTGYMNGGINTRSPKGEGGAQIRMMS